MSRPLETVLIEGYASVFDVEDLAGDVVRAGAFSASLRDRRAGDCCVPMLLGHDGNASAGRWVAIHEDGHGLKVRGLIEPERPAGRVALQRLREGGLAGLSIGFRPKHWKLKGKAGRDLRVIDLVEVSLVARPLLPQAQFAPV